MSYTINKGLLIGLAAQIAVGVPDACCFDWAVLAKWVNFPKREPETKSCTKLART